MESDAIVLVGRKAEVRKQGGGLGYKVGLVIIQLDIFMGVSEPLIC